jgi:hypothetical protein
VLVLLPNEKARPRYKTATLGAPALFERMVDIEKSVMKLTQFGRQ